MFHKEVGNRVKRKNTGVGERHKFISNNDFHSGADIFCPLLQLTCWCSSGGADEDDATSCILLVLIREIRKQGENEGEGGGKCMVVVGVGVY